MKRVVRTQRLYKEASNGAAAQLQIRGLFFEMCLCRAVHAADCYLSVRVAIWPGIPKYTQSILFGIDSRIFLLVHKIDFLRQYLNK